MPFRTADAHTLHGVGQSSSLPDTVQIAGKRVDLGRVTLSLAVSFARESCVRFGLAGTSRRSSYGFTTRNPETNPTFAELRRAQEDIARFPHPRRAYLRQRESTVGFAGRHKIG